jgi:plasmid maintenance system antidote protein VapI
MKKPPSRQILATNLQRLMERSVDKQNNLALARHAKVGHTHIGRLLRMESSATTDMIDALAEAFGVQPWELLTDSESTRRAALQKMMFGNTVSDERIEESFPEPPNKVVAMRRRRK